MVTNLAHHADTDRKVFTICIAFFTIPELVKISSDLARTQFVCRYHIGIRSTVHTLSTRNRLQPYGWFSRSILRATVKRQSSMNFPGWAVRMGTETSVGPVQRSAVSFVTQRIWAMSATTSPRSTTILKRSASTIWTKLPSSM